MLNPICNFFLQSITYSATTMSIVQDSLKRSSTQSICVCVLTMTTFLKAGIRPITGKQRGSEATQNSLS